MRRTHGWSARQVRSVFVSDVHIGSRHSQCEELLTFLERLNPERLYFVGDLIDGWQLKKSFYWLPTYSRLLDRVAEMAARGTRVYYVPGNHDAFVLNDPLARQIVQQLGFVEVAAEFICDTVNGQRFLVTHGDRFDFVEQSARWLSVGVTGIYNASLSANWWLSRWVGRADQSPYRLCSMIEDRIKSLIRLLGKFENSLIEHARQQGCQGVICGHLHTPAIIHRNGMIYCNTGDWVENCTAVLEYEDGSLALKSHFTRPALSRVACDPTVLSPSPAAERAAQALPRAGQFSCPLCPWRTSWLAANF